MKKNKRITSQSAASSEKIPVVILEHFLPMFFQFKGRFVHLIGSAGSGKSFHACLYLLLVMLNYQNTNAVMIRRWEKDVRRSIWEQCKKIVELFELEEYFRFYRSPLSIECKRTNALAIASGCDNIENLKSVAELSFALIDEADQIKEEDFNIIIGRVRSKHADFRQIVMSYNPPVRQHLIPRRFFDECKIMPEFNEPYYIKTPYENPFTNQIETLDTMAIRTHFSHNRFLDAHTIGVYDSYKESDEALYTSLTRAEWGDKAIGIIFNKKYYQEEQATSGIAGVIYCDPNIGIKEQADTTAIVKLGYDYNKELFYVVDAFVERVSDVTLTLDRIIDMADNNFRDICFDGTMTQEGTWTNIIRNSRYDKLLSPRVEYRRYKIDECAKTIQFLYNSGKIRFPVDFGKTKHGEKFLEQMYRFKGKRWTKSDQKDDAPDALIGAIMFAVEKRRARIPSIDLRMNRIN
jgi:PBSX family phage terminase large subunit